MRRFAVPRGPEGRSAKQFRSGLPEPERRSVGWGEDETPKGDAAVVTMGKGNALGIGVAGYHHVRTLRYVDDAKDLAALLTDPDLCGFPVDRVRVLEEAAATRLAILDGLAELALRADESSTTVIYFSGHGGQIEDGPQRDQYLLPVDAVHTPDEDLARTSVSGAEFSAALNAIRAKRLTVLLDCCHAG